jgi:hypothetical protein
MLKPSESPVVPMPSAEQMAAVLARPDGMAELARILAEREKVILRMKHDPLKYGYEPDIWKEIRWAVDNFGEVLVLGGNRGGKSEVGGKLTNEVIRDRAKANVACLHNSSQSSINQQQNRVHTYLPPELRNVGKGAKDDNITNIQYTKANGFTNEKFITPTEDTCMFFNYKQDPGVLEGYELDWAWGDELITLAFIEALRFRLLDRSGTLFLTFTPVRGYTPVVAEYVAGARVIKSQRAPLLPADKVLVKGCPKGHMPRVLVSKNGNAAIVCIWNTDNPFTNHEEMRKKLEGKRESEIKIRAYGWAERAVKGSFSNFDPRAHVITRERFAEIAAAGGCRYVSCDPGGGKPWFIKWYFVTPDDEVIVYREWPTAQEYGMWAKPSDKLAWVYDDGALTAPVHGINGYKALCWKLEGNRFDEERGRWVGKGEEVEDILLRVMDPRFGKKISPGAEQGTSIIELMAEDVEDAQGQLKYPGMDWEQAPASGVEETVQMIDNFMEYDADKPVDALNSPKWFVVEDLWNTILAYNEFTVQAGEKCALKDIVDPDRYFVKSDCRYYEDTDFEAKGGGYS